MALTPKQQAFIFEIGKFYRHTTKEEISIVGNVNTTMWGNCLAAEVAGSNTLATVGKGETATENWEEITKEEWMKNFS